MLLMFRKIGVTVIALLLVTSVFAKSENQNPEGPWLTGPILAPAGHVVPEGHTNWEPYLFVTDDFGVYGANWRARSLPTTITESPNLVLTRGLGKRWDFETIVPYNFNQERNQSDSAFADVSLMIGYQAIDVPMDSPWPQLRMVLVETVPSGEYNNRSATKSGTDITGAGSFQTGIQANFQKYYRFFGTHFLRTRLSLVYTVPSDVHLNGFNSYGGGFGTDGNMNLGNIFSADLGLEYTLTKHWVPALDFTYSNVDKSIFTGQRGVTNDGKVAALSTKQRENFTLAPALEYNFSANLGIIAGVWFTVAGKDTSDFTSYVVALNYYN